MAHDYDDIEEWFGSELADTAALTYEGTDYDALVIGPAGAEVAYPRAGRAVTRFLLVDVRISDFGSGHPAIRGTCTFRSVPYRITDRNVGSTNKTYRLTLKEEHASGE